MNEHRNDNLYLFTKEEFFEPYKSGNIRKASHIAKYLDKADVDAILLDAASSGNFQVAAICAPYADKNRPFVEAVLQGHITIAELLFPYCNPKEYGLLFVLSYGEELEKIVEDAYKRFEKNDFNRFRRIWATQSMDELRASYRHSPEEMNAAFIEMCRNVDVALVSKFMAADIISNKTINKAILVAAHEDILPVVNLLAPSRDAHELDYELYEMEYSVDEQRRISAVIDRYVSR